MAPAAAAAQRPSRRPAPGARHRPALEVVERRRREGRRRLAPAVSAVMVTSSLLLVVIGHSELAQGQVRLAGVESAVTAAQVTHRQQLLSVADLENPSRIVDEAEGTLHMVPPAQVTQLPYVPLSSSHRASRVTGSGSTAPAAATGTSVSTGQ